ncbi:MAG: F0F1 ATP synthase subunit B' [Rhodobacteraceae bacterium]|nr:F0F1 ATP synthase subunit B' [Paracoccaceae bacterium]
MATEAEAAGGAHNVAMPQLDFSTYANQIFWMVVALVAIYLIVTRLVVPRIGGVLAERSDTINRDIAAAEELKRKAVAAETAYNKALADARAEAAKIVAAAKADIQKDLDAATARADAQIMAKAAESEKRIADIRDHALESVTEVARDTAGEIVAHFGGSVDAGAVGDAVAARLKG